MKNLFLSDLFLALDDLLQESTDNTRLKLFQGTVTSQLYRPILARHLDELKALPAEFVRVRPFSDEMGQLDIHHDGFGGAFIEMCLAYLRIPSLTPERRAKIEKLLQEFAKGGLAELKASYPDEAALAKERQNKLPDYEDLLKEFPLADGMTLYDIVSAQIECGIALDRKMSERAKAEAEQNEKSRAHAGKLRTAIIGTLGRCRAALSDELKLRPDLARNIDEQIFGYFDGLDSKRAISQSQEKKAKPEEKPEEKPEDRAES